MRCTTILSPVHIYYLVFSVIHGLVVVQENYSVNCSKFSFLQENFQVVVHTRENPRTSYHLLEPAEVHYWDSGMVHSNRKLCILGFSFLKEVHGTA